MITCYIYLADWMHNEYEKISKELGWKTQDSCQVDFADLPKENRDVMLEVAKRIMLKVRNGEIR